MGSSISQEYGSGFRILKISKNSPLENLRIMNIIKIIKN